MMVYCSHCRSVINNASAECPWCGEKRSRLNQGRRRYQTSLLCLLVFVSIAGVYFGLLLQANP